MNDRLQELLQRLPGLAPHQMEIEQAYEAMRAAYAAGNKLLLCGNGGSAADAEHWAGELLKGFCSRRPLAPAQLVALAETGLQPAQAGKLQNALPAIPLSGFPALNSAFANDVDAELIYAQLVWGLGQAGDVLIGLSTSGNARNVCAAAHVARARGLKIVGLTGRGGGLLAPLCDVCIKAPADETFLIQEYHLPIYHTLCLMLEDAFFG